MSHYEEDRKGRRIERLTAPSLAELSGRQLAQALADVADLRAKLAELERKHGCAAADADVWQRRGETAEALAESYRLCATRDAPTYHREWQAALERERVLLARKAHLERIQASHVREMQHANGRENGLRKDLTELAGLVFESDEKNSVILKAVRAKLLPYRDADEDEDWTED